MTHSSPERASTSSDKDDEGECAETAPGHKEMAASTTQAVFTLRNHSMERA